MTPVIKSITDKKLVGKRLTMSLATNRIPVLWRSFMPVRHKITNNISNDLYSLAIYKPGHFENFKPTNEFEKWAAVEVSDHLNLPDDMEPFVLTGGLYAVFHYKGSSSDNSIFQFIYSSWLPTSGYVLDNRPHFEVLGDTYKNNDPQSEEEIWIPVSPKA